MISKEGKGIKENVFKINNSDFKIINRHYPEDPEDRIKGFLQIGNYKYFFIHGQQFDKLFIKLGPLSNTPTYTSKLSDTFSKIFPFNGWSIVAAFIGFLILHLRIKNDALLALTVVFFLLSIPRLFTYFQDKFWAIFGNALTDKPKYKDIKTIVDEKYYNIAKDKTGWDVNIVFGHTHMPEIRPYRPGGTGAGHEWLFLNTGSWTREEGNYNTFVYLDERGYYLFKWDQRNGTELIPPGETITD